jgi:hypothetical protein
MTYVGKPDASPPYGARRAVALLLVIVVGSLAVAGIHRALGVIDMATTPEAGVSTKPLTGAPLKIRPVQLRIPAINVAADVEGLGLNDDHTVEVPKDPDDVGWYRLGPSPGRPGSAVILGHVDSTRGPAVFYRLSELERGDRVAVRLADGAVAHFKVARVVTYAIEDFPARRVYGRPAGDRPVLNLVTCGGEYDKAAGGYQANVVVYTTYVGTTVASQT